jgi:glycosyltransferase involved in cell wall biosynthesis
VSVLTESDNLNMVKATSKLSTSETKTDDPLTFSVVIIAKNAPDSIRFTLNSLNAQTRKPDEILIVVPSMDDPTVKTANEYGVKTILDPKATRGSARGIGVTESTSDIVAFIDAECRAHPEWLHSLEKVYLENKDVKVQGGPIHRTLDLRNCKMDSVLPNIYPLKYVEFIPTANISFRREVADIAGNFNPRLHEGEDLDFCIRVIEKKIGIVLNPAAIVLHLDKTTQSVIKRYANYGKSRAKVFFLHKRKVLVAAIVAFVNILLIPVAIWALVFQQWIILLLAVGLPFAHQLYRFFGSGWQKSDSTVSAFFFNIVLSYTLYFFFFIRFFRLLFSPKLRKRAIA